MTLGSQSPRAGVSRRHMSSKRRASRAKLFAIVGAFTLLALVWWVWPDGDDAQADSPDSHPTVGLADQTHAGSDTTPGSPGSGGSAGVVPTQTATTGDTTATPTRGSVDVFQNSPSARLTQASTSSPAPDARSSQTARTPRTTAEMRPLLPETGDATPTARQTTTTTRQKTTVIPTKAGPTRTATTRTAAPAPARATSPGVAERIDQARLLIRKNKPVHARDLLNAALHGRISQNDARVVRRELMTLNNTLVFSPRALPDDPLAHIYTVRSGDLLSKIARKYDVSWQFLAHINGITDPRKIRVGQKIKIIRGPFHAVVDKSDYRLDLYAHHDGQKMYLASFRVGLGKDDSTPIGKFIVKRGGKLANPPWTDAYTGQHYAADDPQNPIGEYWVGLRGNEPATQTLAGYGLHGTIEPESIGTQASRGCVRMLPDDIALTYHMMTEENSQVIIVP